MSKKKKGLADSGEGEFILNESGTSVSTDHGPVEEESGLSEGDTGGEQQDDQSSPGINDNTENNSSRLR